MLVKKFKGRNRLKDRYLVDYYDKCLQLQVEIEGMKILESLLTEKSLGKKKMIKTSKTLDEFFCVKSLKEQNRLKVTYLVDYYVSYLQIKIEIEYFRNFDFS